MKKIKKVETARARAVRIEDEELLLKEQLEYSSDPEKVLSKYRELCSFSDMVRKINLVTAIGDMLLHKRVLKELNIDETKSKTPTPEASKNLSEIINIRNELFFKLKNNKNANVKVLHDRLYATNLKLEASLRFLFDTYESVLNGILATIDNVPTFSKTLDNCLELGTITKTEYATLKMFAGIRNAFTHNSSSNVLIDRCNTERLIMFKACILESSRILPTIMFRNHDTILVIGEYIKLIGNTVPQSSIEKFLDLYESNCLKNVITDKVLKKIELCSNDELEKRYIKGVNNVNN